MKLPKKIIVGPMTFKVVGITDTKDSVKSFEFGRVRLDEQTIEVYPFWGRERVIETLIHEVTHAIFHVWGIKDEDDQERITTSLAFGWATVIKDNPKLMKFLTNRK